MTESQMRFAYIDSQGNEVPIPSVDALALRIELGAIGPDTQLYDAQADRWGPAHTHEIFHTLQRDAGEEEFVPPPPVVPPPGPSLGETGPSQEAAAQAPPEADDSPVPEAPAEEPEAEVAGEGGSLAEDLGLTLADAPGDAAAAPAEPEEEPSLGEFGDLDLDLAPAGETAGPTGEGDGEAEGFGAGDEGGGFDFGDFDGSLELETPLEAGGDEAPEDAMDFGGGLEPTGLGEAVAAELGGDLGDAGGGMELESPMDFAGGPPGGGLEMEKPMSEFTPDAPPAWMEQEGPAGATAGPEPPEEEVMDFGGSPGASATPDPSMPVPPSREPPRARPEPRSRPSPPRRRRKRSPVGPIVGVLVVAGLGAGGYFGWRAFAGGGGAAEEEGALELPPVTIPDIPAELLPTMRDFAEEALVRMMEDLTQRAAELDIPEAPPQEWLGGEYLSSASKFPEIEAFWLGIGRFVDEVRETDAQLFHEKYVELVTEAGIAPDTARMLIERADSGFLATRAERLDAYRLMDDLVTAALNLHEFLLEHEAEIQYEPAAAGMSRDPVLEAVPATEELGDEMWALVGEIPRALQELGTLDRVTRERLFAVLFDRIRRAGIE